MANIESATQPTTDIKQLGVWAALGSLSYVFWICGGMEMVERLAYYGVRQISSLYATDAQSRGGLGLKGEDIGIIFLCWALMQSFVPVLTGGISDRLGYKQTIFASTVFKIIGYLIMAWFPTFWGFMAGAMVLAFGTGIFKPGIQATIVNATNRQNSSVAWGVFYQTVNIGGFIGPLLAAQMRQLEWSQVFYTCALIISLNFLMLLTYREPNKQQRLSHQQKVRQGQIAQNALWKESLQELRQPVLIWYMVLLSGFWFMLNGFWDVGPLYFRDWVDTRTLVNQLFGPDGTNSTFWIFILGMTQDGKSILPEGLINVNSLVIMLVCFLVAGYSALIRATSSMALGTFLASSALILMGGFNGAWMIVLAVVCFSFGEMLSSPKSSEFIGNIAPPNKKAMYLGFSQLPLGIGWALEGFLGQYLYATLGSKETIARQELARLGMDNLQVAAIPVGEAFEALIKVTGQSADWLTLQLYTHHNIGLFWYILGIAGLLSALGMLAYGKWHQAFQSQQSPRLSPLSQE